MARYIDADKLAKRMKASPAFKNLARDDFSSDLLRNVVLDLIDNAPTADVVEVRHAKWEIVKITGNGYGQIYYQHKNCPVNSTELYECAYERCPRCGAKMDGGV